MLTAFPAPGTRVKIQFEPHRLAEIQEAGCRLGKYDGREGVVIEVLCRGLGKVKFEAKLPWGSDEVRIFESDDLVLVPKIQEASA